MGLLDFFKGDKSKEKSASTGLIQETKVWYEDRYQSLIVQRNLFFIITALCLIFIAISVVVIGGLTTKKRIEPMVVQVEETTGITTLVNPASSKAWSVSETINKYFLIMYLRAREAYNVASYQHNYNTVTRLFSSSTVYNAFRKIINDATQSPIALYGSNNSTAIDIRSILFLTNNANGAQNVQIRFTVTELSGTKRTTNKIASITWDYVDMTLTTDEEMVNPLGFQVQFYTISDDVNA